MFRTKKNIRPRLTLLTDCAVIALPKDIVTKEQVGGIGKNESALFAFGAYDEDDNAIFLPIGTLINVKTKKTLPQLGLIRVLDTLAHEFSHVLQAHTTKDMNEDTADYMAKMLLGEYLITHLTGFGTTLRLVPGGKNAKKEKRSRARDYISGGTAHKVTKEIRSTRAGDSGRNGTPDAGKTPTNRRGKRR
jgi:hypothetical protein